MNDCDNQGNFYLIEILRTSDLNQSKAKLFYIVEPLTSYVMTQFSFKIKFSQEDYDIIIFSTSNKVDRLTRHKDRKVIDLSRKKNSENSSCTRKGQI